jgi:UDP-N-acetylmuramoylalanine--D-glutamate ligase
MLEYLRAREPANQPRTVAIADQNTELSLSSDEATFVTETYLGSNWLDALSEYDVVVRSPGVPLHSLRDSLASAPHVRVTSSTNLFLAAHADKTIGITATKGKSTTSSLLHHVLVRAGIDSKLGGNIGIPAISLLNTPAQIYVLELSSYQLEDCQHSPHGALFLNLYPEHLDHHQDFANYGLAKANITSHQTPQDFLVAPFTSEAVRKLSAQSPAQKILFGSPESQAWIENSAYYYRDLHGVVRKLFHVQDTKLKGPGNQQNILAVLATLSRFDVSVESLTNAITEFAPLPHRLEEVATIGGVTYINDSISTVPEATINALDTFKNSVKTVILGGYDRGISFYNLAAYLTTSCVENVILFPPSGSRIETALRECLAGAGSMLNITTVQSMREAVELAKRVTPSQSVCLLSPASPSFPIFKNFQERGEKFRQEVLGTHER